MKHVCAMRCPHAYWVYKFMVKVHLDSTADWWPHDLESISPVVACGRISWK